MKKYRIIVAVLALLLIPTWAFAAESPWKSEATTSAKMKAKLDFGIKNLFGGWTELVTEPMDGYDSDGVAGIFSGLGRGLVNAVADTVGGALHVATFYCTYLDVPLPEGGIGL